MTDAPLRLVVDASVGIKLFVDEEYSDKVYALFEQLTGDIPAILYVPDRFWTLARRKPRRFSGSG